MLHRQRMASARGDQNTRRLHRIAKAAPNRLKSAALRTTMFVALTAAGWEATCDSAFAQAQLVVDNNTTFTAPAGTSTFPAIIVGNNSGTVGGVPGGQLIVPADAEISLTGPNFLIANAAGS